MYNSCRVVVSDCIRVIFFVYGVYAYTLCAHLACICACMCVYVHACRGGQGTYGGCTLVYMDSYTDQENESFNHYTYMVLHRATGCICDHKIDICTVPWVT